MQEIKKMNEDLHTILTKNMPDGIILLSQESSIINQRVVNLDVENTKRALIPDYKIHLVNDEFLRVLKIEKTEQNDQEY